MTESGSSGGGGCGCLTIVVTVLVLWALAFGWTYQGKHHGINCSCERGVGIE